MGYITLGTLDQLQVEIPTERTEDWASRVKDNFVLKLVEHDHSGNGKGAPLGANSIADGAVDGLKIQLKNGQPLQGQSTSTGIILDILEINTNNKIDFGTVVENIEIDNLTVDKILGKDLSILNTTTESVSFSGSVGGILTFSITSVTGTQTGNIMFTNDGCVSIEYVGADLDYTVAVNSTNLDITANTEDLTLKILKAVL